jgi:aminoglycoside phosphotransferase (APT) family kinase protein
VVTVQHMDNASENLIITPELVKKLIADQFPEFSHLTIKSVEISGHDNRTFHLGRDLLVRLPSKASYASAVLKEQHWLPKLAPHLISTYTYANCSWEPL